MQRVGHIQPALVNAEGLGKVCVFIINGVDLFGIFMVQPAVGGEEHQIGTFLFRLPNGLSGFDTAPLGRFVFG